MGEQSGERGAGDQCGRSNRGKLFAKEKGLSPLQWPWISAWQVRDYYPVEKCFQVSGFRAIPHLTTRCHPKSEIKTALQIVTSLLF